MSITLDGTTGITSDTGFAADGVSFADNAPANTLVTTAGGNVGVGTGTPTGIGSYPTVDIKGASGGAIRLGSASVGSYVYTDAAGMTVGTAGASPLNLFTNGAERARIDASGNLLVGTTSVYDGSRLSIGFAGSSSQYGIGFRPAADNTYVCVFRSANNTLIGSIQTTATTTSFVTSSDYRLKDSIQPMQNALARNALLNPVKYKWRVDGSDGEGFIAHELQTAFPAAVTGTKDAVDSEGKPVYQGIGTGPLDGHFAACVNELQAIIQSLTQRIAALEGASDANTGVPA